MHRSPSICQAWPAAFLAVAFGGPAAASDGPSPTADLPALARRAQDITDAVLAHHIDPPSRQQMFLEGIKAVFEAAGVPAPDGLARRISLLSTPEQFAAFLAENWPHAIKEGVSPGTLEAALGEGLLGGVAGGASLVPAKEVKVLEQFAGNRYVGVHIALAYDEAERRPEIKEVFEGGPADRAGAKEGDLIEEIDGVETRGLALREAIDRLRGAEGTDVTIRVRQRDAGEARVLRMTRGTMPRQTIMGLRKRPSKDWDVLADGPGSIGYLRIEEVVASTPHELRRMARQLESEGAGALVLDLRAPRQADLHAAILLADGLLEGGPIGRVRTVDGETTYRADPDALFRGWPMAVLIDGRTSGAAEWLAAALQDTGRAVIVGAPTMGFAGVQSTVPVADGAWSIQLMTGLLLRADGRPIGSLTPRLTRFGEPLPIQHREPASPPVGVVPDFKIGGPPAGGARPGVREPSREAPRGGAGGGDAALEKALEVLRKKTLGDV